MSQSPNDASQTSTEVTCPQGHSFRVKSKYAGQRGKCPTCQAIVDVPSAQDTRGNLDLAVETLDNRQSQSAAKVASTPNAKTSSLGRFQILATLGEGAFGTVYRAHDPQLDREVAIKVPRMGALISEKDVERFLRESRAAAQLRHPNIVPIYDAGQSDGTYYIASAFIPPGRTLRDRIREEKKLDQQTAAQLLEQIAIALHYAHTQGIVHRDVKPDNVLLDKAQVPHVADFGLARREAADALLTQEGTRMGTPAYMSPEQHRGRNSQVDARSDQWSLGVMLYEMLTGERPFQGDHMQLLHAVTRNEPASLRAHDPSITRDLETICLKCLAKGPAGRYTDCDALAADLRRWLRDEPIRARRVSWIERGRYWSRREPQLARSVAAVIFLTVVAVAGIAWGWLRAERLLNQLSAEKRRSGELVQTAGDLQRTKQQLLADVQLLTTRRDEFESQLRSAESEYEQINSRLAEQQQQLESIQQEKSQAAELADAASQRAVQESDRARQEQLRADEERQLRVHAEQKNVHMRYAESIRDAYREFYGGDYVSAARNLMDCPAECRSWEWDFLYSQTRASRRMLRKSEAETFHKRLFEPALPSDELARYQALVSGLNSIAAETRNGHRVVRWVTPDDITRNKSTSGLVRMGCDWLQIFSSHGRAPVDLEGTYPHVSPQGKYLVVLTLNVEALNEPKLWEVSAVVALWNLDEIVPLQVLVRHQLARLKTDPNELRPQDLPSLESSWIAAAFAPDESEVVVYFSGSNQYCLFELPESKLRWSQTPPHQVSRGRSIAYTRDGLIAISSEAVSTIDLATGEPSGERPIGSQLSDAPVVLADGDRPSHFLNGNSIYTVSTARRLTSIPHLEMSDRPLVERNSNPQIPKFCFVRMAADDEGTWFALRSTLGNIEVWKEEVTNDLVQPTLATDRVLTSVVLGPRGEQIAVAAGSQLSLWDTAGGPPKKLLTGNGSVIRALACSPRDERVAHGTDEGVRIWDTRSNQIVCSIPERNVSALSFDNRGVRLVVGTTSGVVRSWDPASGKPFERLQAHRQEVRCIAFSAQGRTMATGSADHHLILWSVSPLAPLTREPMTHAGEIRHVAFSPDTDDSDSRFVATAGNDGTICIWDCRSGSRVQRLQEKVAEVKGIAFSPDGRRILSLVGNNVRIWDWEREYELVDFAKLDLPISMCLTHDGRRLVVADRGGTIHQWLNTGKTPLTRGVPGSGRHETDGI